jgi:Methyltransferase domain
MSDHIDINLLNWEERAAIHAQDTTGDYMLGRFRAGEDSLHAIETAELGDISGKRVLHLQCHIGRDTLSLARRGATVTGLDFSKTALDIARRLSEETGLKAEFVQGTVDLATDLTPAPFDFPVLDLGPYLLATRHGDLGEGHRIRVGTGGRALLCRRSSSIQCAGGLQRKSGADIRLPDACRQAAAVFQ